MVDPTTATTTTIEVGNIFAILRDGAFAFGILVFGWKARDFFQPIFTFFSRANQHMTTVEETMVSQSQTMSRLEAGMSVAMNNHLRHIEHDIRVLSGRKTNDISNDDMVE